MKYLGYRDYQVRDRDGLKTGFLLSGCAVLDRGVAGSLGGKPRLIPA
jgi:hypothetical protein